MTAGDQPSLDEEMNTRRDKKTELVNEGIGNGLAMSAELADISDLKMINFCAEFNKKVTHVLKMILQRRSKLEKEVQALKLIVTKLRVESLNLKCLNSVALHI